MSKRKTTYRYVRLGSHGGKFRYVSLWHNPFLMAWWLYWYGKPFDFTRVGIRQTLGTFKRLLHVTLVLLYYRVFSLPPNDILDLSVLGHVCISVHNGYKIFDLRRQIVTKMFSPDTELDYVRREIQRAGRVGQYHFAPNVRDWNVEERWYEEDYINGHVAKRDSIIPILESMIKIDPQQQTSSWEYAEKLKGLFEEKAKKFSKGILERSKLDRVRSFVAQAIDHLHVEGDRSIYLVFSHGDFSARHVFRTDHGLVGVDWEEWGQRSALFDLYDVFFQPFRHGTTVPDMAKNIDTAITQLQSCLTLNSGKNNESLIASLDRGCLYRFMYYVESICLYGERRKILTPEGLEKILLMIDAYNRYEERLLDYASQGIGSEPKDVVTIPR